MQGRIASMVWRGDVKEAEKRIFFHLLSGGEPASAAALACARFSENAAMLALPQPALAVVGQSGAIDAGLCVLATDHLCGHTIRSAGLDLPLLQANSPVDVNWDFAAGALSITAATDSRIYAAARIDNGRHA